MNRDIYSSVFRYPTFWLIYKSLFYYTELAKSDAFPRMMSLDENEKERKSPLVYILTHAFKAAYVEPEFKTNFNHIQSWIKLHLF